MNIDALKKDFLGELWQDKDTLSKHSRDYSIFAVTPTLVACPKTIQDVKTLVRFATHETIQGRNTSLTARAAGTDMTGGPLNSSIVVSFTPHFNQIKQLTQTYARVETGVYFRDLEKRLIKKHLLYPPYPASKDLCAIGGMLSNNSGGEKTLAYGKTEQYVKELTVVLSDGEAHLIRPLSRDELDKKCAERDFEAHLYRSLRKLLEQNADLIKNAQPNTSKNSAGYALWNIWDGKTFDLTQLFVGAQGTLGLITEAKLKLVKPKKYSRLTVIFLKDLQHLAELVTLLLKHHPESLESYDDKTLRLATTFWRELIKNMKGDLVRLAWQFMPEFLMTLKGGFPSLVLLVELTDDRQHKLEQRLQALNDTLVQTQAMIPGFSFRTLKNTQESQKYWAIRRHSFALLHAHHKDKQTAPFIDDIAVHPTHLSTFLPELNAILDEYKNDLLYTIAGHPGDGNFHIIPLMDLTQPRIKALIPIISERVYKLVLSYKGTITAEHNDGLIRTPYLEQMYGKKMTQLFKQVKTLFDSYNIFNPGKKVGGSLKQHFRKMAQ